MKFRKIFEKENEILSNNKITFLIWPRQVWKTTFLKKIYSQLTTPNKKFLNLENYEFHRFFTSFSNIQTYINSLYSQKWTFYLFLDEFQKVKNIDNILKLIYDELPFVKVIASGSNNIEINKKIKESLAGRKRIYYIRPLDFEEFLIWKENLSINELKRFVTDEANFHKIQNYLEEFLIYWGFPEVVQAQTIEEKKQVLSDIFDYWFNRDIVIFTQKLFEFKELTKQLAFWMWNILNYSNLASLTHLSAPTVKKFIETLEETFIVFRQRPFFRNKLKEINKSPKLYFIDPGFRNWFISRYEFSPEEKGILFENFILTELIKKWKKTEDLKFRRTNDEKYEVDLVLESEQKAYEIKFKFETKKKDFKWLEKFLQLYPSFTTDIITRKNFLSFIK